MRRCKQKEAIRGNGRVLPCTWFSSCLLERRVRPFVRAVRTAVRASRPRRHWWSAARSATP